MKNNSRSYRSEVGPVDFYDRAAAMQFCALTQLGMREHHSVLDVGCGSLRVGRLLIPFLQEGLYTGIEPDQSLVEAGIKHELSQETVSRKKPKFLSDHTLSLSKAGYSFDFVLAISLFSGMPLEPIKRCLAEVEKVLAPEGKMIATYVLGDSDYEGLEWKTSASATYRPETFNGLVEEAGLGCARLRWEPSTNQEWVVIARPKTSVGLIKLSLEQALSTPIGAASREFPAGERRR